MKRLILTWPALAVLAFALIAAACGNAGATDHDADRGESDPTAEAPADRSDDTPATGRPGDGLDPDTPVSDRPGGPVTGGGVTPSEPRPGGGVQPGTPPSDHDLPTHPELAPIDELEVVMRPSLPPHVSLRVVSGIPSGCASYASTEAERDGDTFTIRVWNHVVSDPNMACTMIYGMHEQYIDLGQLEPGHYVALVNGEELRFEVPAGEGPQTDLELAPIDTAELLVRESYPPQYAVQVVSGLPSGCSSFSHTTVDRSGTTITVEVWNEVVVDPAVSCIDIYEQHRQVVELGTDFEPGTTYTVHVNDETLTFVAQ